MRRPWSTIRGALTALALLVPAGGFAMAAGAPSQQAGVYAFVDVHVVPMDRWRILEHQTVVVRDGVIRAIGDTADVEVPANAVRIRGEGRYLLPGLGDMYARLPVGDDVSEEELQDLLFLYLANGVTTVRQGPGEPQHTALKRRLLGGELTGPTLYVSSPPLRIDSTFTADSVEAALEAVARQQWDLVRVPEHMPREVWDWMASANGRFGLAYGGAVPDRIGLRYALATGISTVDHLDGLLEAAVADSYRHRVERTLSLPDSGVGDGDTTGSGGFASSEPEREAAVPPPPLDSLARATSPQQIRAIAGRARAAGVWMVPALRLSEIRHSSTDPDSLLSLPEMRYVSPEMRGAWVREKESAEPVDPVTARRIAEARMTAVKALNDVAGGLLVGTDSPHLFNVPGFSIHREMERMRAAGVTPYEVLIAATRNVARFASGELGESGNFGTVTEGNRADLVLVEDNPLEGLDSLRRPEGVMVRGSWLSRSELDSRLEAIAEKQR